MERLNRIWQDPQYQEAYRKIQDLEKDRIFCGHSAEHFLDVARLIWIYNLEDGGNLDRECVYAAAFLHDIGRHMQYLDGTPHHKASADLAEQILPRCGFSWDETQEILAAIRNHRNREIRKDKSLSGYLYKADKQSRNCMSCGEQNLCDWPKEKKNLIISY